ncbi:MAG: hypothetical protein Q7U60_11350 [Candidatus Methanoperedens sp.]|nr:hypothetical protein [Candidatus Methanoperedens sp.]
MEENKTENPYFAKQIKTIKSAISSSKQTLILGLSSSLNGGAAYGYIVSLDYHYFTPELAVIAGFIGGFGIAARDIFSEKEKNYEDIPLKDIVLNVLFGVIAMFLGYLLVYYFVKLPSSGLHGTTLSLPAELGTIVEFLKATMGVENIIGAILGSISALALPMLFREKIRALMKALKINQVYSASK